MVLLGPFSVPSLQAGWNSATESLKEGLPSVEPKAAPARPAYLNDGDNNAAADPRGSYLLSAEEIEAAVACWTKPDVGRGQGVVRWAQRSVPVSLEAASDAQVPGELRVEIQKALAWVSAATGTSFHLVDGDGPFKITVHKAVSAQGKIVGAHTRITVRSGTITTAHVELSEHGNRQVWEEIVQAAGPMGDHGLHKASVMTPDEKLGDGTRGVTRASAFDARALRAGYAVAPGSGAEDLRRALQGP